MRGKEGVVASLHKNQTHETNSTSLRTLRSHFDPGSNYCTRLLAHASEY